MKIDQRKLAASIRRDGRTHTADMVEQMAAHQFAARAERLLFRHAADLVQPDPF